MSGTGTVAGSTIYKVTVHGEIEQQQVQFGFHLRQTGFLDATDASDVLPIMDTWTNTHLRTILNNTVRIVRTSVLEITTKEYAEQEYTNRFGTLNEQSLPAFVAVLVSLRSPVRSRHRNGRMYWFGIAEGATSGSVIQPTALAVFQPVLDAFNAEFLNHTLTKPFNLVVVAQARPATVNRPAIEHSYIDIEATRIAVNVTSMGTRRIGRGS